MVAGGQLTLLLTDVWGRLHSRTPLTGFETVIDLSGAAPGVYFWQVAWGQEITQSGRVVKVGR